MAYSALKPPHLEGPFRVYVGLAPHGYLHDEALGAIIREGIKFCQLNRRLTGKVLIRPDLSGADERLSPYAYTNPQVVKEILGILAGPPFFRDDALILARAQGFFRTENALLAAHGGVSAFKSRGYYYLKTLFPHLTIEAMESTPLCRYLLAKDNVLNGPELESAWDPRCRPADQSRYWAEILGSRHFLDADCVIYTPKIRTSLLTGGFSGALKLGGMGSLLFHQERQGQDLHNDRRMVDMLEVANPDIVVGDGIIAPFGGNELTGPAHELGVVLVADNALAHDMVAARILGLDPEGIDHIRMAQNRGWGPDSFRKIMLGGAGEDGIKLLQTKTRAWTRPPQTTEAFRREFEHHDPKMPLPLEILEGPRHERSGVHGVFLSWLYLNYDFPERRAAMARWPKATVVLGETNQMPSHRTVYVLGDRAAAAFRKNVVEVRYRLKWGSRELVLLRLRNGRTHRVIFQAGSPPSERNLCVAFLIGSWLRVRTGFLRLSLPQRHPRDATLQDLVTRAEPVRTSNLPRNGWWARV